MTTQKKTSHAKFKKPDLSDLFEAQMKRVSTNTWKKREREYRFHETRRWRFDFAWPNSKVAVECDGGQFKAMGGRHNTDKDREKINTATSQGWRVFRFSGNTIKTDPLGCLKMIEEAVETFEKSEGEIN